MHRKQMKAKPLRSMGMMATANLDAWIRTPRVWIMMLCAVIYCWMQAANGVDELQVNGIQIPFTYPEMLFIKLNSGFFLMASILFLVMVSELPRRIGFQNYMLSRTTRVRWVLAVCLYCIAIVIFMIVLLILCYSFFALPNAGQGNGYTETALIESGQFMEHEALIPTYIRLNMSPAIACLLAVVPMFFFWFTMVLIIVLCGLLGCPLLGPVVYGFLLLSHVTMFYEALPGWLQFPIAFSTLRNITIRYTGEELSRFLRVVIGYLIFDGGLVAALVFVGKKADLHFSDANSE